MLVKKNTLLSGLDMVKEYGLDFLLYLTCCLPFLRILPIPSDVQPYAFVVAFVFLIVRRRDLRVPRFHRVTFILFVIIAAIAIIELFFDRDMSIMTLARKVYNYAALYIVSLALVNSLERTQGLKENWIKFFILLWLVVGVIQIVYDKEFLSCLISNYRTNKTRGVCGLASEPSFYGYVMVFFFVLANEFKRGKWLFQCLCIVQIVALAQSAVAFVYLAVFAGMFIINEIVNFRHYTPKQKKMKLLVAGTCMVMGAIAVVVVLKTMGSTRFVRVWVNLFSRLNEIHSMDDFRKVDGSIARRVEAIIISIQGFIQAWGLPNGFGKIVINGVEYLRIMSGYGGVIYELGIIGIALIIVITCSMVRGLKNGFVSGISISICMFSAIQPGSPMFIFVLACALYAGGRADLIKLDVDDCLKQFAIKVSRKRNEE